MDWECHINIVVWDQTGAEQKCWSIIHLKIFSEKNKHLEFEEIVESYFWFVSSSFIDLIHFLSHNTRNVFGPGWFLGHLGYSKMNQFVLNNQLLSLLIVTLKAFDMYHIFVCFDVLKLFCLTFLSCRPCSNWYTLQFTL